MTDVLIVFVTTKNAEEALRLGEAAVEARLAACANIVGPIRSVYRWKGEIHRDDEHLLLLKTTRARLEALTEAIRSCHGAETPEIVAVPVEAGSEPYLRWVAEETAPRGSP